MTYLLAPLPRKMPTIPQTLVQGASWMSTPLQASALLVPLLPYWSPGTCVGVSAEQSWGLTLLCIPVPHLPRDV